jgi:protein-S-isoprenylcysteine O-methyltransferase Ste14
MTSKDNEKIQRESKYSHLIQLSLPISFIIIWILDSFVFLISTVLNSVVPLLIRIILFAIVLVLAFFLLKLSHDALFSHNEPSDSLITSGILGHVRNPLYLGVLLIYVAFICLSISLISIVFFIFVALIYNSLVNYEEKVLEELFGEDWLTYKKQVPKWIPR